RAAPVLVRPGLAALGLCSAAMGIDRADRRDQAKAGRHGCPYPHAQAPPGSLPIAGRIPPESGISVIVLRTMAIRWRRGTCRPNAATARRLERRGNPGATTLAPAMLMP